MPRPRIRPILPKWPVSFTWLVAALLAAWEWGLTPPRANASLGGAPIASTAPDAAFDDPKLTREWGALRSPAPSSSPAPSPAVRATSAAAPVLPVPASPATSVARAPKAASPASAAAPALAPPPKSVPAAPAPVPAPPGRGAPMRLALSDAGDHAVASSVDVARVHNPVAETSPPVVDSSARVWPYKPVMKVAYRRFPFARAASSGPSITAGTLDPDRPESFESLSLDFYPISSYLRVGLSTQFGWESGLFDRSGDYFLAESASAGLQIPGRFTPFVEGLAGGGYMRRQQSDGALPSVYWQLGIDAGVEIYFARRAYISLAAGYLRPGNLLWMDQNLRSVKVDTWSMKVGLGI